MNKLVIKTAHESDFFGRGKRLAGLADQGKPLPREQVISFEDPAELLKVLSAARLDVLRAVREQPDSITNIAARLHRDRSAVKRDVDQLEQAGIIIVEERPLPGHGRMKLVRPAAQSLRLEAELA